MKIKTITCHDVYNAGAGLQAYALMTYLTQLGHEVEIIDYKPDYLSSHYSFFTIGNPIYAKNPILKGLYLIAKFPGRLCAVFGKRKKNYDAFKKNYLKVTSTRYSSNEQLKEELPEADVYFAGSDQIWNPLFQNGKDPAFYLDFVPDEKIKASYAASFSMNYIPDKMQEIVKKRIERLDYVSVRESSGVKLMQQLGITKGVEVLDPVFLLERKEWDKFCENVKFNEEYVLVYDFDRSKDVKELAKKIAAIKGCKIFSIFNCDYADKSFQNSGPVEFVGLIKNAEFVISNSFHATAFSLIFQRQFFVVNRQEKINARMHDLLGKLGLEERIVFYENVENQLREISYEKVEDLLSQEIQKSRNYIETVMSGVKENEKKKILFVINSLGCGGAEKSLVSLLPLIDYQKYEVDVQMINKGGMFEKLLPDDVRILPTIEYFEFVKRNLMEQIIYEKHKFFRARINLSLQLRKNKRGINKLHDAQVFWKTCGEVIGNSEKHYDVAIAWGQGTPTHYVAEKVDADKKIAWINADYEAVGHNRDFDRDFYDKYNKIITVSSKLLEMTKTVFPEFADKMQVILDIQNQDFITQMSKEDVWDLKKDTQWLFVTVGRLVEQKGYDIALEACKQLHEEGIDFKWLVIGEGPERKYIEKKIEEYSLQKKLILLGAKSNPYPYVRSADVYVQTSKYEGYCLTVAEARTLNIPVVTTNFEVIYNQMINEKNGLIVEMTGKAVANGIKRMINDNELRASVVFYLKNEKKGNTEEVRKIYEIIEGQS